MLGKSSSQIFTQGVAIPSEPGEPHHPQCDSDSDTVFTTAAASTPSFIDLENMRPSFLPNPHIPIMNDDIAAAAAMHVPNADVRGPPSKEKNYANVGRSERVLRSCSLAALSCPPLSLSIFISDAIHLCLVCLSTVHVQMRRYGQGGKVHRKIGTQINCADLAFRKYANPNRCRRPT